MASEVAAARNPTFAADPEAALAELARGRAVLAAQVLELAVGVRELAGGVPELAAGGGGR